MEKYLSLFDYLGHPAGSKLGKEVATAATQKMIRVQSRHVSTPKYVGQILMYPETFLKEYFSKTKQELHESETLPF